MGITCFWSCERPSQQWIHIRCSSPCLVVAEISSEVRPKTIYSRTLLLQQIRVHSFSCIYAYTVGLPLSYLDNTSAAAESYAFLCAAPRTTRGTRPLFSAAKNGVFVTARKQTKTRGWNGLQLDLDLCSYAFHTCLHPVCFIREKLELHNPRKFCASSYTVYRARVHLKEQISRDVCAFPHHYGRCSARIEKSCQLND